MTGASSQGSVQSGKVIDISNAGSMDQGAAMSSSGSGMSGTAASGASGASGTNSTVGTPAVITVLFDNGTQARYAVDQQPEIPFATGDSVKVITDKDGITIFSP